MLRTGGVGWGGAEYRARPRGAEVRRGLESEGVRKVCMESEGSGREGCVAAIGAEGELQRGQRV